MFAVVWHPIAEAALIRLWLRAANPVELADAADAVNRLLRDSPFDRGESRGIPSQRIWFHPPLCVLFQIDTTARDVYIESIKWIGE
jgi:hypothetical protein